MKRLMLSLVFLTFAILGHAQDTFPINPRELPKSIQEYVSKNFPDANYAQIERDDDGEYEILLSNQVKIDFDRKAQWESTKDKSQPAKGLPFEILPDGIASYIEKNYPNALVVKIELDGFFPRYNVELNNDLDLEFDKKGKFLRIDD